MPTAILFFSHVFDATALEHFRQLKSEAGDYGTLFVYADVGGDRPPQSNDTVVTFDFDKIKRLYPHILGQALIPGNCHLTLLDFFRRYPDFDYYWVVEYDVEFTGRWRDFFGAFADNAADFLACHIRHYEEEPDFYFWSSLQSPDGEPLPRDLVRAFCPIQRLSRRALEFLEIKAQQGWVGHFEALVPTLLRSGGFALTDIGGDGRYVPPGFRNRFYTSFSWKTGELRHLGSMRFRPPVRLPRRARKNTLYHPVKRRRSRLSRSDLRHSKEAVDYIFRNLRQRPADFSRALTRFCVGAIASE